MTKLLIVSDSHGRADLLNRVAMRHPDADVLLHLGDGAEDAARFAASHTRPVVHSIRGNCDFFLASLSVKEEAILSVEEVKLFACHGHRYGVKRDLMPLFYKGLSEGAGLVLFGHTHEPLLLEKETITLLNPGSLGQSSDGFFHYATVEIEGARMKCRLEQFL